MEETFDRLLDRQSYWGIRSLLQAFFCANRAAALAAVCEGSDFHAFMAANGRTCSRTTKMSQGSNFAEGAVVRAFGEWLGSTPTRAGGSGFTKATKASWLKPTWISEIACGGAQEATTSQMEVLVITNWTNAKQLSNEVATLTGFEPVLPP